MKKQDIATLVFIASLSVFVAYFIANAAFGGSSQGSTKVETVKEISPDVEEPDKSVFNKDANKPTVEVIIGDQQQTTSQ